jgi:hypothetical protein
VPKEHHQANLGELCSFPEPVLVVAASQHVQGMGEQLKIDCSKTTLHTLISRHQTKPLVSHSEIIYNDRMGFLTLLSTVVYRMAVCLQAAPVHLANKEPLVLTD